MKFSDIITVPTLDEVKESFRGYLSAMKLPVLSWSTFSLPRAIYEGNAESSWKCQKAIADIGKMGLLLEAEGDLLDLHGLSNFQLARNPAIASERKVFVTNTLATSRTWGVGAFVVTSSEGPVYRNYEAVTISAAPTGGSTSVTVAVRNDAAGVDSASKGSLVLSTPYAGITVSIDDNFLVLGTDTESDALYQQRCTLQWSKLTTTGPKASYAAWAREIPSVTRVGIKQNKNVSGTDINGYDVEVYVANSAGYMSPADLTAVRDNIELHSPLGVRVHVDAATPRYVALTGTVLCSKGFATSAKSEAAKRLDRYFANLTLGDTIYYSKLIGLVDTIPGVVSAGLIDQTTGRPLADTGKITTAPSEIPILRNYVMFDEVANG